jgi:hypothetical protein
MVSQKAFQLSRLIAQRACVASDKGRLSQSGLPIIRK